jgi:hypothetical protein
VLVFQFELARQILAFGPASQPSWRFLVARSWLGNFRRLVVAWKCHLTMVLAFFHLACLLITLGRS